MHKSFLFIHAEVSFDLFLPLVAFVSTNYPILRILAVVIIDEPRYLPETKRNLHKLVAQPELASGFSL